jgi:glucose-6-phosphate 1-dehydrogenase
MTPNQIERSAPCTTIVIFGASGDLTWRKLIPALYNLYRKGRLPQGLSIVGFARRPYSHDDFRAHLREGTNKFSADSFDAGLWEEFAAHIWYARGDLDTTEDYTKLNATLSEMEHGPTNRLYYLATAPNFYAAIVDHLAAAGMAGETEAERRIVVEKPFGRDLETAQALNQQLHSAFQEHQIYRIDHYLGKETAQNIMFFRFGNTVFENVWNRNYIDHVQITVAEEVDVGRRAGYYDTSGVLRDMFQNHLLHLLALVAMEAPASFDATAVRNEIAKVFSSIRPLNGDDLAENTVRAQYQGYRDAEGVSAETQTATYAALRLFIDNWRWKDVPFYLRSGKAMHSKVSEVVIQFRHPPHTMFPLPPGQGIKPDVLSLCIQPDEGIHFRFEAKVPDTVSELRSAHMTFHYDDIGEFSKIPEAYERLLLDALIGDATLFIRSDVIEMAWNLIDPIIGGWHRTGTPPMASYEPGTWGPPESEALLMRDGRAWLWGCDHSEHAPH